MKSVEIGRVKLHLQKTPEGYEVTRGTWSKVQFDTYSAANDYWESLV